MVEIFVIPRKSHIAVFWESQIYKSLFPNRIIFHLEIATNIGCIWSLLTAYNEAYYAVSNDQIQPEISSNFA